MPYETALHQRQISYPRLKSLFQHASCGLEQAAGFNVAHASAPLRHCSGLLWGGGKARTLAMCAHHAALVVIGLRTTDGHCTGGRPPSFGVWQWCDMRAVTNTKPAFARHANKRHCAGCLSGNGKSRELAARAHCTALTVIGLHAMEGHYTGERPLFFCAPPWCDVRAVASCSAQPAFA